jgi:hypothetical protein
MARTSVTCIILPTIFVELYKDESLVIILLTIIFWMLLPFPYPYKHRSGSLA